MNRISREIVDNDGLFRGYANTISAIAGNVLARKMGSQRVKKVNELVKRELGAIILKEVDFPRGVLVTLTKVEVAKDMAQAKAFVSVMPSQKAKEALEILNREIYSLQQKLNQRLVMKTVPKIEFHQHKAVVNQARVDQILNQIKNSNNSRS